MADVDSGASCIGILILVVLGIWVIIYVVLPVLVGICVIGAGGGILYGIGCSTYNFIQACKDDLPNRS